MVQTAPIFQVPLSRPTLEQRDTANRALTVAIDTTGVYVTQAGIARYVNGLMRGIKRVAPDNLHYFPLAWEVENFGYKQPWRALRTAYRELIWGKFSAPAIMQKNHADVFHATSSLFMRVPREVRHIVTLHDLSISRHPERFRPWQVRAWNNRISVIRNADRIITISQFTAHEAMSLLELPARKIEVIPNGCDWHPDEPKAKERAPEGVS